MINKYSHQPVCKNGHRSYFLNVNMFILSFFFLLCGRLNSQTLSAEQIYEKVKDAVVMIYAYDYSEELAAQGSGVVLNDKGYVVTNYHVLSGSERLEIMHGEEIIPYVDIIGIDVEKDILILKIEEKKFPAVKLGDAKELKVGQRVYAIGSPMGFENTISEGIISGLRSYEELSKNYIQITASISPGSSGGAVVNDKGELIGISTLTAKEGQNLNFAIPIDDVLSVEIGSYSKNNAFKDFEYFDKGLIAAKKGDYIVSIKYFSQFLKIYPSNAGAYYNRGLSQHKLEDYSSAIQDYNKAIGINPYLVEAYDNRGSAEYRLGNDQIALKDYNSAIAINPMYFKAFYNRGNLKYNLGDRRGAILDYSKAIKINPDFFEAYSNRGNAKAHLNDYKGAIQDYDKAIDINPNYVKAYFNRGVVRGKLGDLEGSIIDYNEAIEINPNYNQAYYNRGIVKYNLGDIEGACLDWSKAGELGHYKAYEMIREYCN